MLKKITKQKTKVKKYLILLKSNISATIFFNLFEKQKNN